MLTWPWVSIEWNTPPIHTVEASARSSGTVSTPVAQHLAVRSKHFEFLRAQCDVGMLAVEEREHLVFRVAFFVPSLGTEEGAGRRLFEV